MTMGRRGKSLRSILDAVKFLSLLRADSYYVPYTAQSNMLILTFSSHVSQSLNFKL